jgi:hypothetical protein
VRRRLVGIVFLAVLFTLLLGCAGTIYVPEEPPLPRDEVRPERPGPRAIWIDGHWMHSRGQWVWAPGRWERNPRGEWVPGRWEKTHRGWRWHEGHWKR